MNKEKNQLRYGNRVLAKGHIISDDTRITGLNSNDLIIGGSGAGKTGSVVVPTIQESVTSIVVSDTKGNLMRLFRDELLEKGYEIFTIDFVNPRNSCGYNPLDYIRRHPDGEYNSQDIMFLAQSLVPKMDNHDPFWEMSATSMIAFFIAYCLMSEPSYRRNMTIVSELYHDFIRGDKEELFEVASFVERHRNSFLAKKFAEVMSNKTADKMYSSICGFVNKALEPYTMRESTYIFSKANRIDLSILGKKKTALFLNVSDTDPTYDVVVNTLYGQILHHLCAQADENPDSRLEMPVRIIMDDFAASARIESFDRITSVIRSRDIFVTIILQSLTQLHSMYSEYEAETILNNCDHILYMSGQDQKTIDYVSSRAMVRPESVRIMPRDKAFLMVNGQKGLLVDKIEPYSTVKSNSKASNENQVSA
ncbi:VirD4-like conjugal transfer protein, CD1115 family [Butyrivibrio sp. WCD2001]|uniref:VirD4-like conjugal transfer protein, CD1115 family n=1 Tax=Butyrivibrio sp. WCD2001 TaxID=1280681 RepID=UPI00042677B5|nr:type IV secretory system conjugative DNA transfer family protein [Butyrivibrio sp. WCD2001]